MMTNKNFDFQLAKVNDEEQVVMGFAFISTENGKPYVDSQGDFIDESAIIPAVIDFMKSDRVALRNHEGPQIGQVLGMFPLTSEFAKSAEIQTRFTGPLIFMHIEDREVFDEVKKGNLTGFSIAGRIVEAEEVEE